MEVGIEEMWSELAGGRGSYHRLVCVGVLVVPKGWPLVGNLFQVAFAGKPIIYVVRDLREKFGPIFTLRMGKKTLVIITCPEVAHEALIEKGTLFANRPPDTPTKMYFSANKCSVNSSEYGSVWRTLLTHVDDVMKEILLIVEPQIHDFLPILRPLFARQWKRIKEMRRIQMDSILPLVNTRRAVLKAGAHTQAGSPDGAHAYIDSLMNLELPEGRGKPTDEELVTLCSELLTAGTDTTSTALEWAMLRMVMHQDIQETLYQEICDVVGDRKVEGKDIENLPYLNAVVKETLRRYGAGISLVLPGWRDSRYL
jgi:hypothetical protein